MFLCITAMKKEGHIYDLWDLGAKPVLVHVLFCIHIILLTRISHVASQCSLRLLSLSLFLHVSRCLSTSIYIHARCCFFFLFSRWPGPTGQHVNNPRGFARTDGCMQITRRVGMVIDYYFFQLYMENIFLLGFIYNYISNFGFCRTEHIFFKAYIFLKIATKNIFLKSYFLKL